MSLKNFFYIRLKITCLSFWSLRNAATTNFAFHEYHEKNREISAWIHARKIHTAFTWKKFKSFICPKRSMFCIIYKMIFLSRFHIYNVEREITIKREILGQIFDCIYIWYFGHIIQFQYFTVFICKINIFRMSVHMYGNYIKKWKQN